MTVCSAKGTKHLYEVFCTENYVENYSDYLVTINSF